MNTRLLSIVGARPQFIKAAPVCRAVEAFNGERSGCRIEHKLLHTGQHYDREMADLLFEQLAIPKPDYNLGVGSGSFGAQLGQMVEKLERVLQSEKPEWVLVYGDTNSTLAGALVAVRLGIPVAHVEAGCRSYRSDMPEEQNRVATDHLSKLLLTPSQEAARNLDREGIGRSDDPMHRRVSVVGDLMFDALIANASLADERRTRFLEHHGLEPGRFYLLTLHRAENTDKPENLKSIVHALGSTDFPVLFPVHPRTAKLISSLKLSLHDNLRLVPPLGYLEMLCAEKTARKILTDSGGVQKEAFYLKVPCVTLRDETEWPETISLGANILVGADPNAIVAAIHQPPQQISVRESPFGDGRTAQKIVSEILNYAAPEECPTVTAKSA